MTVYLDCNATTPIDPRVAEIVMTYMTEEFGNPGSRTHEFGARANEAVKAARRQVASVVGADPAEVIFTSGATESNNIAILGLIEHGEEADRKHVITTQVEHKAVLEPFEELEKRGFEVDYLAPNEGGWVEPARVAQALRDDTLLVSIMHVNNETGVLQPLAEVADLLQAHDAFFHTDAAQGFGKDIETLRDDSIDLISISGHKIYGPKGVGALVMRRRNYMPPPLSPLIYGGGQERKLRPGTLPSQLVVGLGLAAELAEAEWELRREQCEAYRETVLEALAPLEPRIIGDQERCMAHVLNVAFEGVDNEAAIVALKEKIAISNGSACTTSKKNRPSHVLQAMELSDKAIKEAVRISWCHMTEEADWTGVVERIERLR
jgi:cysteine desulfurase